MRRRPVRTSGRRAVQRFQASLERRQNSPVGRLAVDWFQRYLRSGRLVQVLPQYYTPDADINAVYPQRHQAAARVGAFVEFLLASK